MVYIPGSSSSGLTQISDQVLATAQASFSFLSIPQTYKHLYLVVSVRSTTAGAGTDLLAMRVNNVTTTTYVSQNTLQAYMSIASVPQASALANSFMGCVIWVPDYAATTKLATTATVEGGATSTSGFITGSLGGALNSAAAVSRIDLFLSNGANLSAGSRATLYGMN